MNELNQGCEKYVIAAWIVAFGLFVIIPYPSNAVSYQFLGEFPIIFYFLYGLFIAIASLSLGVKYIGKKLLSLSSTISILIFMLCTVSYIYTQNPTIIRDGLTILLFGMVVLKIDAQKFISVLRKYIIINAIFLSVSLVIVLFWSLGLVTISSWHVLNLDFININSPLLKREEWGDFLYHMPFYLVVIPLTEDLSVQLLNIYFLRQPLLYTESTYTWLYTGGLLLYVMGDMNFPYRKMILTIFGFSLLISYSFMGMLVMLFALVLIVIVRSIKIYCIFMNNVILYIFCLFVSLAIAFNFHVDAIKLIDYSKYEQYIYWLDKINFNDLFFNATSFGEMASGVEQYGCLAIINRYGIIGFALYAFVSVLILFKSIALLPRADNTCLLYLPGSVIFTVLLSLKVPQLNPLLPLLLLTGSIYLIDYKNNRNSLQQ